STVERTNRCQAVHIAPAALLAVRPRRCRHLDARARAAAHRSVLPALSLTVVSMNRTMGLVLGLMLSAALGLVFWAASRWEARLAEADRSLAALRYDVAARNYAGLEASAGRLAFLPWFDGLSKVARDRSSLAGYWGLVAPSGDASPAIALVAANAAFRAAMS